ncbi:MAG: hypothetical protein ACRDSJ_10555 [Rubrobacteraceae bacterium]
MAFVGKRGNPNWVKGMKSVNPAGRSKDTGHIQLAREDLRAFLPQAIAVLKAKVLEGDMVAMKLYLERAIPKSKGDAHKIAIKGRTLLEKAESILDGTARGEISIEACSAIIRSFGGIVAVQDYESIIRRIEVMEGKDLNQLKVED